MLTLVVHWAVGGAGDGAVGACANSRVAGTINKIHTIFLTNLLK